LLAFSVEFIVFFQLQLEPPAFNLSSIAQYSNNRRKSSSFVQPFTQISPSLFVFL
jgi:hypothetical protein